MRLICTGFHQLAAAESVAFAQHDVVTVDDAAIRAMWTRPRTDWWREAAPPGWEPDVALIGAPEYFLIPPYLAELPCPVVLWIGDWYMNPQAALWLADQVELILADATGMRALRRSGIEHVEEFCPWTFDPNRDHADWDVEPDWDIGFLGNFNAAIQFRRNRLLWRVARMDPRWRIRFGCVFGPEYARFLQRSRITFNYSVTGDINMRCFEAAACGSLVTINRAAAPEAGRWFEPGREIVVYDEDNLEDVLEHYLRNEDQRRAIARAGWERVQSYGPVQRLEQLLDRLEELAEGGRTIRLPRNRGRDGAHAAAHVLSTLGTPPLEGAELLLEEGERVEPSDAGVQLSRAVMYTRYGLDHPDRMRDAASWAEGHFARATQLDPTDATAWLAYAQFEELVGGPRTTQLVDRIIAGIRDGTLVARPDRQRLPRGVTPRGVEWQHTILESRDSGRALTGLVLVEALELAAKIEPLLARRVELLEEAIAVSGTQPQTAWALVEALLASERLPEALSWLQIIHSQQPLSADAWVALVRVLVKLGRDAEAHALVEACAAATKRLPGELIMPMLYRELEEARARAAEERTGEHPTEIDAYAGRNAERLESSS